MSNYGVSVTYGSEVTPRIKIESKTIIGIATTKDLSHVKDELYLFTSPSQALLKIVESNMLATGKTKANVEAGALYNALYDIEMQNVKCPVVVAVGDSLDVAVKKLKESPSRFLVKPNLIVLARDVVTTNTNPASIVNVAETLNAIAIVDVKVDLSTIDSSVNTIKGTLKSKRVYFVHQSDIEVSRTKGDNVETKKANPSPLIAGMIARLDGNEDYGFALSPSNQLLRGAIKGGVDFTSGGDCTANKLREKGINSIIATEGYRLWGDVTNADPTKREEDVFKDVRRLRIIDTMAKSLQKALFFAIDNNALDELPYVKEAVFSACNRLKGANVLLGFSVFWDEEKNTRESVHKGEFYLTVTLQEVPTVKKLKITLKLTDRFAPILLKAIA